MTDTFDPGESWIEVQTIPTRTEDMASARINGEWHYWIRKPPTPPLPTEPGFYLDRNGTVMILDITGWMSSVALSGGAKWHKPVAEYAYLAPFRRLIPEDEK